MFDLKPTGIPGCFEIRPQVLGDERGRFVKVFHGEAFASLGLNTDFPEEYYSVSRRGVIRGLHFQTPPMEHVKLVFCVEGCVRDAVVDLRRGSPTYGAYRMIEISAEAANMLYIPKGLAHGFCALSDSAVMVYKASTVYSPQHDSGVRYDSAGIPWAMTDSVLSVRDRLFPPLAEYPSPFSYDYNLEGPTIDLQASEPERLGMP